MNPLYPALVAAAAAYWSARNQAPTGRSVQYGDYWVMRNKFDKRVGGVVVKEGKGFAIKKPAGNWVTISRDPKTWPAWAFDMLEKADEDLFGEPKTRTTTTTPSGARLVPAPDGVTIMRPVKTPRGWGSKPAGAGPWALFYDAPRNANDLIKSLPGRHWQPEIEGKPWAVKIDARTLPRVLEVAKQIGATIDPTLQAGKGAPKAAGFSGASTSGAAQLQTVMRAAARKKTAQGYKPYHYQLEGIEFLARRSHLTGDSKVCALLADDMGTGKTIQTLLALPKGARGIFVVPAVVVLNWAMEAATWRPDLKVTTLTGRGERLDRLPRKNEILILNYERLPKIKQNKATGWKPVGTDAAGKSFMAAVNKEQSKLPRSEGRDGKTYPARLPIFLVSDEAQMIKNRKTQRAQAFSAVSDSMLTTWLLTGTPMDNRPPDLWGLLQAGGCAAPIFGWGTYGWDNYKRLMGGRDAKVWDGSRKVKITVWPPEHGAGVQSPQVPELMRRVMLRRLKTDVLKDLPPKVYETVVVEPKSTPAWTKARKLLDKVWSMTPKGPNGPALPPFNQMSEARELLARVKIPALIELIEPYEDAGKPVVVAGAHLAPLKKLAERPGWAMIIGGMPKAKQQRVMEDFQAGKLRGVAISSRAAGIGITLTRAETMIFADLDWNPGVNVQAEDRIHRIGQTGQSTLFRTLTTTHPLDRHVTALLRAKKGVIHAAIDQRVEFVPPAPPKVMSAAASVQARAQVKAAIADVRRGKAEEKLNTRLRSVQATAKKNKQTIPKRYSKAQVRAMEQGLSLLAGSCDFAIKKDYCGFNKPDVYSGHALAEVGLDNLLARQVAYGILRKYRKQLGSATWDAIYAKKPRKAPAKGRKAPQRAPRHSFRRW